MNEVLLQLTAPVVVSLNNVKYGNKVVVSPPAIARRRPDALTASTNDAKREYSKIQRRAFIVLPGSPEHR